MAEAHVPLVLRDGVYMRALVNQEGPVAPVQNRVNNLLTNPYAANSNQRNRKFVHEGRMYFKNRDLKGTNQGTISAICDQTVISGCKGRAWFLANGTFVKLITVHGCEADPSHIMTTAITNEDKNLAATTTMETGDIINQVRDQARLSGIQDTLPPVGNRKRAIQRVRFNGDEAARPPPIPQDLRTFVVPHSFAVYEAVDGREPDEWLLGDSGFDENINGRILIFGRGSYRQWMHMVRKIFVDGTFKIAPPLFEQVFVVLAERNGFVFPVATALLPNKRMASYRKLFEMLRDVFPELKPDAMSCDYEIGIQNAANAAKEVWPGISIDGCYWHLCANLYKHLQDEGLSAEYDTVPTFAHQCRKIVAMTCVPIAHLDSAFMALQVNLPAALAPILKWFEQYYLGKQRPDGTRRTALFPIDSWNLVDRIINDEGRTNNYAEAHHRKVAGQLGVAHPTLWKFINSMKLVQRGMDGVYAEMALGRDPPKKRLKYRKADERMKKSVVQASGNWQMVVPFEYLGTIAYNFRMAQGPYEEMQGPVAEEVLAPEAVEDEEEDENFDFV